jgi:hypothetical protein
MIKLKLKVKILSLHRLFTKNCLISQIVFLLSLLYQNRSDRFSIGFKWVLLAKSETKSETLFLLVGRSHS